MRRIAFALLLLLGLICAADRSAAQPLPDADLGEKAVGLGRDGLTLFEKGELEEARARFAAADALSPSPVFRLYVARCLRHTGRLLAARAAYAAIRSEKPGPTDPPTWTQARADAAGELAAVDAVVPAVRVLVRHAPKAGPTDQPVVTVDRKPVEVDARIEIDPGDHVVSVTLGETVRTERFTIAEGAGELGLAIDLAPPKRSAPRPAPAPDSQGEDVPASVYAGGALLGVGAASLIAGVVTGALALSRSDEIGSICGEGGTCPESRRGEVEPLIDEATALGHTSTATLVAGAAFAATGLVLVVVKPGAAPNRAGVRLAPSFGGFALSGGF